MRQDKACGMMEVRLSKGTLERKLARLSSITPTIHTSAAWGYLIGSQGGCGKDCSPREWRVPVSPEPSGDSLWLSMALPALGLDSWSLLGLFLFQLLLLLLPPPTTARGDGQGPTPRVKYYAGKCLMIRKCGDGNTGLTEKGVNDETHLGQRLRKGK